MGAAMSEELDDIPHRSQTGVGGATLGTVHRITNLCNDGIQGEELDTIAANWTQLYEAHRELGVLVDDYALAAGNMLGGPLVTIQTGPDGQLVRQVLVEQGCDIARELYLGVVIDRASALPVLMVSSASRSPAQAMRVRATRNGTGTGRALRDDGTCVSGRRGLNPSPG